ncbi:MULTISPECIES: class I SAM-dependent DNA methyltransferase [Catenuloplanes]|uniref:SAM-dependent methyltransferase n=1 Tax=Catenuloplanes niger TaxID=587534 RepID=A0AAE3ZRQ8_9ACTN|nr:class I SAM-dependent methyltransferase [Catenuloplanes niger]MDR7322650.1 SAM-dependent methyltransferase [Catenuloplanes niger]
MSVTTRTTSHPVLTTPTDAAPGSAYGDRWAEVYDDLYDGRDTIPAVVDFIRRWAQPASVLELGVGTGRLAIPLAAAGMHVVGVDNSEAMLARLRAKPGGDAVDGRLADMTDPPTDRTYGCVLIAFSTLYLLADQNTQRRCIQAAADRLAPGGALIIEGFIPDPDRWHNGHSLHVEQWDSGHVTMNVGRLDAAAQTIDTLRVTQTSDGTQVIPNRLRYLLPAELDLIAEHTGLGLAGRYGDLAGRPIGSQPTSHVSVYTRPETAAATTRR